jgi:hypothetical protein
MTKIVINGKAWTPDAIKNEIELSDRALYRALLRVYANQTNDEQENQETNKHNGVGFTGCDARILSSFSEQLLRKGYLSEKQKEIARRKLPKYATQIFKHIKKNVCA